MKLNIANPATGAQKKIEIDDENRLQAFMDKRIAQEINGDSLGDEFKGYVFKITGGNDKDGFPMRQGVLLAKRVRLLLRRGMPCYKAKRKGDRRRKAVRGCVVGPDIAALSLIIVKRGEKDLPGLTDDEKPRRLGPKRIGKIRKMFNLTKKDDVRNFVVRRKVVTKNGKKITKKPKIQRLITSTVLHRRRNLKRRVERRKEMSYQKRKEYFETLTKKSLALQKAQKQIKKNINVKKNKKQSNKKDQKKSKKSNKQKNVQKPNKQKNVQKPNKQKIVPKQSKQSNKQPSKPKKEQKKPSKQPNKQSKQKKQSKKPGKKPQGNAAKGKQRKKN